MFLLLAVGVEEFALLSVEGEVSMEPVFVAAEEADLEERVDRVQIFVMKNHIILVPSYQMMLFTSDQLWMIFDGVFNFIWLLFQ